MTEAAPIAVYVDADACPVKAEVYRVAERHGCKVFVVSNSPMAVPRDPFIERVVVPAGPDVADDWIAERATARDVVVTADIPLADRSGEVTGGPKPFSPRDRSEFLQALHRAVERIKRGVPPGR